MKGNYIKEACILVFLGVNSWTDIRKRQVSLLFIGILAGYGMLRMVCSHGSALDLLLCAGTGLIFVGISILTDGSLGMGDGWLIMALGTVMCPEEFFTMLFVGMLGSAVWAGIILTVFRRKVHAGIPFVPFLLAGYLGGILL